MTPTPTPAQQDDLEQLEGFLQTLGGGSLVFCLYSSLDDVDYVQNALKDKLEKPLERRVLNAEHPNPLGQLRELPPEPARVVFMVYLGNLQDDLKLTAGYANVQREVLNEVNHTLVLWFGEESFARFVKAAPDFWAWHSGGVFEFQGIAGRKPLGEMLEATEATLPPQLRVDRQGLERRAESYKAILDSYTNPTKEDLPYLARTHHRYADVLADLQHYEQALKHVNQAIDIARTDLGDDALLAQTLNLKSLIYNNTGKREEALAAIKEVVSIQRRLAQTNPRIFLPSLTTSLSNLGGILGSLGRRKEALEAAQEAVDTYSRLAQLNPTAFLPYVAGAFNNLSLRLRDLGRKEEAKEASQKAVEIYRGIAKTNSEALPDLAMSLDNLSLCLSDLGRKEEALEVSREAVEIYRGLTNANPEAFQSYLAGALNNLSNRLGSLGRLEEALVANQEALGIRRELVQTNPDAFLPDLATSINNLSTILSGLGRSEEALKPNLDALAIYQHLSQKHPDVFLPDVAGSMNNLSVRFSNLGRKQDALNANLKAVEIYRQLSKTNPDAFSHNLAISLNNLGTKFSALSQHEEALNCHIEAIHSIEPIWRMYPQAVNDNLITLSDNYLSTSRALNQTNEQILQTLNDIFDNTIPDFIREKVLESQPKP